MKNQIQFQSFSKLVFLGAFGLTLLLSPKSFSDDTRQDTLPEVVISHETSSEIILSREGENFIIKAPEDAELTENVKVLTSEQQVKFQNRRSFILSKMLSLLHWKYLKNGKGMIVGNRIIQNQNDDFMKNNMNLPDGIRQEVSAMHEEQNRQLVELNGGEQILFKKMAHDLVLTKLRAIDSILHQYAGLMTNPKEIGFSLSAGFGLGAGNFKKLWGGAHLVGINIGIDFESKSLIFEVSHISEKMLKAITPVVVNLNIPFNLGAYIKNPKSSGQHHGVSTYAPGVPFGVSGYSNYMEIGFMYGYPPVIFDFFGYFSSSVRSSVLKIQVSPLTHGFLKIDIGQQIKTSLVSIRELKKRWFPSGHAVRCQNLFAAM